MTKVVPLPKGLFALVDDADFDAVIARKWRVVTARNGLRYAYTGKIPMHRFVFGDVLVDHKNSDGLDNRRENLRQCSQKQNVWNRRKLRPTASRFKGVRREPNSWLAEIEQGGVKLMLGRFTSEFAAARQYDRSARIFFGQFAKTNDEMGLFDGAEDRLLAGPSKVRPRKRKVGKQFLNEMRRVGIEPRFASHS